MNEMNEKYPQKFLRKFARSAIIFTLLFDINYIIIIDVPAHVKKINNYFAVERWLGQGERTKFDRFVDPNVRGAKRRVYIRIYESIVIEFFLRLKIHRI